MAPRPKLAPHQEEALKKLQNGSILWGGVGSGKSRVGLAYYLDIELPEKIYVITTAKKRDSQDWVHEAYAMGEETRSVFEENMVVDSWNMIHHYTDVKNAFFIFDEQRLVGSGAWTKSFLKIAKNNSWILLSATPGDTWLDYIPVFVAHGFYKNRTQFKQEHVIYNSYAKFPKVERYVGVGKLIKYRNQILVKMPYERETIRNSVNVWVDHDELELARVTVHRWNIFKDEPLRDVGEMFHVMRKVVNSDQSRIDAVEKLLQKHPRLIVFYNFNYELDALREAFGGPVGERASGFKGDYAEWNGHRHDEIPTSANWVYLVQYIAGAEGWNCVETDAICFYSLTYSYKLWEQAHGRIDRLNTSFTDLYYYVLRSKAMIDHAIWRSLKSKRNFQTADFDKTNAEFAEIVIENS